MTEAQDAANNKQQQIEALGGELKALQAELLTSNDQVQEMQGQVENKKQELSAKEQELEVVQSAMTELQAALQTAQSYLEQSGKKTFELESHLAEITKESKEQVVTISALQGSLEGKQTSEYC